MVRNSPQCTWTNPSLPPDWISPHAWNSPHYFSLPLLVYTLPCFIPTRVWVTFTTKCFILFQVLHQEFCECNSMRYISLDHAVPHLSISSHAHEPLAEFWRRHLDSTCFPTYLTTLWAPRDEGPVSALSVSGVPLAHLALYKCSFLFCSTPRSLAWPPLPCAIFLAELLAHSLCLSRALHIFCLIFSSWPSYLIPPSFTFLLYKEKINTFFYGDVRITLGTTVDESVALRG